MITEEIIQEALRIRTDNPRMTFRTIAETLLGDGSYATALRKLVTDVQRDSEVSVMKMERRRIIPSSESPYYPNDKELPPQFFMEIPSAPTVKAKNAIIVGDLHCPHVDKKMMESIIYQSRVNNIDTLILAGDLIDGQFTGRHKNPPELTAPASEELRYMRHYLRYFEHNFADVYALPGNHDTWVTDYFEMTFAELIHSMLGNHSITVSDYGYVFLNDNIVVGHLEEWHETPGYLAWKIAQQFGRHAIVNHDHIRGIYTERNNPFYGVSIGAAIVPSNIYYKKASFNSFPAFQMGYAILTDYNKLTVMAWDGNEAQVDSIIHLGS